MAKRDARADWQRFAPGAIPSKSTTAELDGFLTMIRQSVLGAPALTLLDVGCGTGWLGERLFGEGFSVVGIDINPEAVKVARQHAVPADSEGRSLRYELADFSSPEATGVDGGPFDIAVCQLVLSIIGDADQRSCLLKNVHDNLRPRGWCYLSASGVSDTINAGYAALYAEDGQLTGERHSYYSRDPQGTILYETHHFTRDELDSLLATAGFGEIRITTVRETSSRRPDEAAFFHYVTCRRG